MKYILILFCLLGFVTFAYADRVCIEKSTGKFIEFQSGDAPLGTLTQNAVNAGYKKEDIEEKEVTQEEYSVIKKEWIDKPAQDKAKEEEKIRKQKEEAIKQKLNLSEVDWQNLKSAIK